MKEQQTVAERSDKSNLEVFRVKQALSECHERLALLDSLQRLRTARLSQARQRGKNVNHSYFNLMLRHSLLNFLLTVRGSR